MSLIKNISYLKIKGGIFDKESILNIFSNAKHLNTKICLLYGKNGSGKSTISRAFNKIISNEDEKIDISVALDKNKKEIEIDNVDKNTIFVFNEKFIDDNIKITYAGLNTIVIIGDQKNIDDKIVKLKPLYEEAKKRLEEKHTEYEKYDDSKNTLSPLYYQNEMNEHLKGDKNWAGRMRCIHNRKHNYSVIDDTYKQFINFTSEYSRDELIIRYNNKIIELKNARSGIKEIKDPVNCYFMFEDVEEKLRELLHKKIEEPKLSEREKYLFSLLKEENGARKLLDTKNYFSISVNTRCPFCAQVVNEDYASDLIKSIEKILNKNVEEHQEELKKLILKEYCVDFTIYDELNASVLNNCKRLLYILNNTIIEINTSISEKINNIYSPIVLPEMHLSAKYNSFIDSMRKLELNRIEYNKKITDTNPLITDLDSITKNIAMYDIKDSYEKFTKQSEEKKNKDVELEKLKRNECELMEEIAKLEERKKNVRIAENAINDDLKYIFFSKNRLQIKYQDTKYILYSHEKAVQPNNVSAGERNAIGLCYFFNRIKENKNDKDAYNQPYIIVIDDPVSSFDIDNRIGIMSYLKYQLYKFALGNISTRILIMTHDLQTLFDSNKIISEILNAYKKMYQNADNKYSNLVELREQKLFDLSIEGKNEYSALLNNVYNFALEGESKNALCIGNVMRRVLEAFGTFTYKKGIEELSTDKNILGELDDSCKKYFENLMYRLVLNGESHMKERVESLSSMDFFDYITDSEKQRTAKDVICFLYKLNKKHVLAHLKDKNAEGNINSWFQSCIE